MPNKRKSMARPGLFRSRKPFLDTSDEEAPAPETPAKAPRTEVRVQLPPATVAQFRAEAQRLVIDTEDLSALSQGAARENLEGRLGLEPGTFNSSRRMRHWAYEVLQGEVDKRAMRSARINQITQALCHLDDYPLVCRRMLIESLPFATACPSGFGELVAPHPHQVRILEMVREVLEEARLRTVSAAGEASRAAAAAVDSHDQREASSASAAMATAAQTKATLEAKTEALRDAQQVETRVKEDFERTKQGIKDANENLPNWRQALADTNTVRDGFLRPLIDGTCSDSALIKSLEELQKFLQDQEQAILAHAAGMALVVAPAERTAFLQIVVGQIEEFFDKHLQKFSSKIAEGEHAVDPSYILKEEAVVDAALWNSAQRMLDVADAREKHEDAESVCKVESSELDRLHKAAMDLERTAVAAESHAALLAEAVAGIDELTQRVEVPAPSTDRPCPGAEQVAEPGTELASESVDQDTIMEASAGSGEGASQSQKEPATLDEGMEVSTPAPTDAAEAELRESGGASSELTAAESLADELTAAQSSAEPKEGGERSDPTLRCCSGSTEDLSDPTLRCCSGSTEDLSDSVKNTRMCMVLPMSSCTEDAALAVPTPQSPHNAEKLLSMTPRKAEEKVDSSPRTKLMDTRATNTCLDARALASPQRGSLRLEADLGDGF